MKDILTVIKKASDILEKNNIENKEFNIKEIFKKAFNYDINELLCNNIMVNEEQVKAFYSMIEKRLGGVPLQYIIGEWDFYNLTFLVGEGVLIPRQDTEVLVDEVLKLDTKNKTLLDLCSGSGCVGITIEKNSDIKEVFLLEKCEKAFSYLTKNKTLNNSKANLINDDLMNYHKNNDCVFDIIVSNPPYINEDDMKTLSKEVKNEPQKALFGGSDGLFFYEYIAKHYKNLLKEKGFLLFEIGYNQKEEVTNILIKNGYKNIECFKDLALNDRVIKCNK